MSIDTLNAYCGRRLVRRPCLAQGRFCIPLAPLCEHWALVPSLLEERGFKLRARLCFPANSVDSWDTSPGSAEPSASDVRRGGLLLSVPAATPNFCFDLRAECGVWGSLLATRRPVQVHLDWGHGPQRVIGP